MIVVEPVRAWSPDLERAAARLLAQLSASRTPPGRAALEDLLADPQATLLVALAEGEIVGMALVAMHRKLTHLTARLEEVVVDEHARGRGAGEALVTAALDEARRRGAPEIELRTSPWREAANRLYPRLGFRRYDSNVYLLDL
ncbi:MAG TPA: GNAT family N-acetyltransferase [Terriglobales bacterium]|nr:GNAT family N-acetyltransferase [Terriglobales bacterium]